jgi:hypothetical protein
MLFGAHIAAVWLIFDQARHYGWQGCCLDMTIAIGEVVQNQKRGGVGGMRQFQMMNQSITMQPNGLRHLTMIGAARGGCAQNTHLPPWPLNSINE